MGLPGFDAVFRGLQVAFNDERGSVQRIVAMIGIWHLPYTSTIEVAGAQIQIKEPEFHMRYYQSTNPAWQLET